MCNKRKWLTRLNQNGKEIGETRTEYVHVVKLFPGLEQAPKLINTLRMKRGNLILFLETGKRFAKDAENNVRLRDRKKQMSICNGSNTERK